MNVANVELVSFGDLVLTLSHLSLLFFLLGLSYGQLLSLALSLLLCKTLIFLFLFKSLLFSAFRLDPFFFRLRSFRLKPSLLFSLTNSLLFSISLCLILSV